MSTKLLKKSMLASLTVLVLSGCVSQPDTEQRQQQLHEFIAKASIADDKQGNSEVNWWQRLSSEQLNQLVNDALLHNLDLQTSQHQLDAAFAAIGIEKANYYPQGDVTLSSKRTSIDSVETKQSQLNVNVAWQLDLFGRITALVEAANAGALSKQEQLRQLKVEVVSAVVKGYVSYQGNLQKQRIIEQQIDALEQSISVLQARVEEGVANELDLNRTLAQLKQQQALLPQISYDQYSDLAALAVLTGNTVSDFAVADDADIFTAGLQVSFQQANFAISMRPDLLSSLMQFSQASALSSAATRALLPDISLSGFAGVLSLGNQRLDNSVNQWQIAPQIEWSLLSYPALLAQQESQQYLTQAAYSAYQSQVLKVLSETELSLQGLVKQSEQLDFANQRYMFANKAFWQAEAMYEEGQIPYLELLDARQDVLIAQENAVDSTIASLTAKVNAYQAFNGRWSKELIPE